MIPFLQRKPAQSSPYFPKPRNRPMPPPNTLIHLIGTPMDCGKRRQGCMMGPDALRTAQIGPALRALGHDVRDCGNLSIATPPEAHTQPDTEGALYRMEECALWTATIANSARTALAQGALPIFMGGDHALSLGSVSGVAAHAAQNETPLFVLWLDAHADFHTPQSTSSGHLHGTPLGYVTGRTGFERFPPLARAIPQENVCIFGLRSVDGPERTALRESAITYHDMRDIDERGIVAPISAFLQKVAKAGGALHVSLDVDFLDPAIAPGVGTTVPGGTTIREAHLVMELIHDSALMASLDLVELNPFLDERGRTAQTIVDLTASALGRKVFDRPTPAYS